jgi:predicted TIM-barrel fold metal-dependent hydrolase
MDDVGINVAILSTGAFSANGHNFCKICNNGYSEIIKKYPKRFRGMIQVYPYDGKRIIKDEIKRGVEKLGLWGVSIVSSYQKMTIDSPLMDPIYEMATKYNMPVFVHPTVRTKLWGGEKYDLYITVAREYDIAKSFVEIIYGVLPRYPELKVIMAHLGGGLPALKGRLLAYHQPKDFPLSIEYRNGGGLTVDQAKELGLFDDFESRLKNIFFDSAGVGAWLPAIKSAFESLGPDHLCFGTDYPYELGDPKYARKNISDVNNIDISNEDKEKFFSANLKKLFLIK